MCDGDAIWFLCGNHLKQFVRIFSYSVTDAVPEGLTAVQCVFPSVQEAGPNVESVSRASCSSTDEGQPRLSCSESQPLPDSSGTLPAWMAEARTFGTVQTYFHCLVRSHFQGLLKVRLGKVKLTISRHQPQIDPFLWYDLCDRQQGCKVKANH